MNNKEKYKTKCLLNITLNIYKVIKGYTIFKNKGQIPSDFRHTDTYRCNLINANIIDHRNYTQEKVIHMSLKYVSKQKSLK